MASMDDPTQDPDNLQQLQQNLNSNVTVKEA